MRVTLKTVNEKLAELGMTAELVKAGGYFLFRGGEAEDWIDRTVAVPAIGSLTMEQWLQEYQRLKTLNHDIMKAGKQTSPEPAKAHKEREVEPAIAAPARDVRPHEPTVRTPPAQPAGHREAPGGGTLAHEPPPPPVRPPREEACGQRAELLAELDQAHKDLVSMEEQEVRAAREDRLLDLVNLSVAVTKERNKFDRALLALRDHTLVHGCR